MKKKLFRILICAFLVIIITGCATKDNRPSLSEIAKINDEIIRYFQSDNVEYDNYSFNYVDERSRTVVVGLLDNSKEQQDRFRKIVINSDYLVFVDADFKYDGNNADNQITLN